MKIAFRKTRFTNKQSGLTMYTVRPIRYSTISEEAATDYALHNSNLNRQELVTGFAAIRQAMDNFLLNGHNIVIDGLGVFFSTARTGKWDEQNKKWVSGGADSMDGVDNANIKTVKIGFRPCTALRKEMQNAEMSLQGTKTLLYRSLTGQVGNI